MQKTLLNPRKPKGLRPLLAALLLVLGAQAQLGPKCQLALLLPRPPPPAPSWRSFRSSCRLGSWLCNGCCPQEVTLILTGGAVAISSRQFPPTNKLIIPIYSQ